MRPSFTFIHFGKHQTKSIQWYGRGARQLRADGIYKYMLKLAKGTAMSSVAQGLIEHLFLKHIFNASPYKCGEILASYTGKTSLRELPLRILGSILASSLEPDGKKSRLQVTLILRVIVRFSVRISLESACGSLRCYIT
jgi:hypothetical protein